MRKYLFMTVLSAIAVTLISWGVAGHKTVATIADNHLTLQAKEVVKRFLGNESMADVSSWADRVLRDSAYSNTASWHYLNVPLGLSYVDFKKAVTTQDKENVYTALLKNEAVFTAQNSTKEQRADALKFIIHLVGDLHQPMHVSRAEDKGGNSIQLQYEGKGTNLHSLWDSRLIGTEGKSFEQMSVDYDNATPKEIKQWQKDDVMKWLFESYQISSKLYGEVEQNNKLDENYYKEHIGIVQQRIKMGGIRLAGVINQLAKSLQLNTDVYLNGTITHSTDKQPLDAYKTITIEDAAKHIGENVSITAKIYSYKELDNMTLVNLGADYPNQLLTVVLKGSANGIPKDFNGKIILVKGKLELYQGKPEIIVSNVPDLQLAPTAY